MRRTGGDADEADVAPATPIPPAGPRTMRLPVGFVLLAAACALVGGVGLYALGFHRGAATTEARLKNGLLAEIDQAAGAGRARDPVARPETDPVSPPAPSPGIGPVRTGEPQPAGSSRSGREARGFEPGLHYLVLMQVPREGADRFVRFCADQGLAVEAVNRDNAWLVVWLPGHASASDPEFGRVRAEALPRLAAAWRDVEPRGADFKDAYVRKID